MAKTAILDPRFKSLSLSVVGEPLREISVEDYDDLTNEAYLYYSSLKSAIKKLKKQDKVDLYLVFALSKVHV